MKEFFKSRYNSLIVSCCVGLFLDWIFGGLFQWVLIFLLVSTGLAALWAKRTKGD